MDVGLLPQLQAGALFLLPVAIVLAGLTLRQTRLDSIARWIPATVAFDLGTSILFALVVRLDIAFIVSRASWLVLGGYWLSRRWHRLAKPEHVQWQQAFIVLASGVAAFSLSANISRNYSIWDRQFHIPLVALIRAQRLPFLNTFQPGAVLHYHFAGDVLAAALQCFSGGRLHASLALALAHDLMFGLAGICLAGWLVSNSSTLLWILPAVLSVFLTGPLSLFRVGIGDQTNGYSFLNLLTMSFRPHVSLAILLLIGVLTAVLKQTENRSLGPISVAVSPVPLALCLVLLGITDEPSAAIAGVGLAACWLVFPGILARRRDTGLVILVAIALSIVAINFLFRATLAPGGPVQAFRIVQWRSPGYIGPPISLLTRIGAYALLMDLGPYLLIYLGVLGFAARNRTNRFWVMAVFLGVVLLLAVLGLTRVDVNGVNIESHRFMTVCEVLFPVMAIGLLSRLAPGSWERIPVLGALFFSAACTLVWSQNGMGPPEEYFTNFMNCRSATGAQLLDSPRPTYIPRAKWFYFAGCRPVFSPGLMNSWASLYTGGPDGGRQAFATLHTSFVGALEFLSAACPVNDTIDPVCRYARLHGQCVVAGAQFESCRLSPRDREALLLSRW